MLKWPTCLCVEMNRKLTKKQVVATAHWFASNRAMVLGVDICNEFRHGISTGGRTTFRFEKRDVFLSIHKINMNYLPSPQLDNTKINPRTFSHSTHMYYISNIAIVSL